MFRTCHDSWPDESMIHVRLCFPSCPMDWALGLPNLSIFLRVTFRVLVCILLRAKSDLLCWTAKSTVWTFWLVIFWRNCLNHVETESCWNWRYWKGIKSLAPLALLWTNPTHSSSSPRWKKGRRHQRWYECSRGKANERKSSATNVKPMGLVMVSTRFNGNPTFFGHLDVWGRDVFFIQLTLLSCFLFPINILLVAMMRKWPELQGQGGSENGKVMENQKAILKLCVYIYIVTWYTYLHNYSVYIYRICSWQLRHPKVLAPAFLCCSAACLQSEATWPWSPQMVHFTSAILEFTEPKKKVS